MKRIVFKWRNLVSTRIRLADLITLGGEMFMLTALVGAWASYLVGSSVWPFFWLAMCGLLMAVAGRSG